jgi:hypothetical protein
MLVFDVELLLILAACSSINVVFVGVVHNTIPGATNMRVATIIAAAMITFLSMRFFFCGFDDLIVIALNWMLIPIRSITDDERSYRV